MGEVRKFPVDDNPVDRARVRIFNLADKVASGGFEPVRCEICGSAYHVMRMGEADGYEVYWCSFCRDPKYRWDGKRHTKVGE